MSLRNATLGFMMLGLVLLTVFATSIGVSIIAAGVVVEPGNSEFLPSFVLTYKTERL